nr:MAG TPA: hypothetical protein [Crassvirales sp.]
MPQTDSFLSATIDMEYLGKMIDDITSNQQLDDDIQTRRYEMMEHYETPVIPMNRHERRAAKAKYNKLNKRKK